MDKDHIISEIKRIADQDGKPPGRKRFEKLTGITNWYGTYWARWGDALSDAGFKPNSMQDAIPIEEILDKYLGLAAKLTHVPTEGELRMHRRTDSDFPSHGVFLNRLGRKQERLSKAIARAKEMALDDSIVQMFEETLARLPLPKPQVEQGGAPTGFVYLMKSGRYYKIGRTNSIDRRRYEIGIQLPEGIEPIHSIETDDPSGIESYWHNRFKDRRMKGEWFDLSSADVRTFMKRKTM